MLDEAVEALLRPASDKVVAPAGVTEPLRTSALSGAIVRLWSAQSNA